jgi:hypothetical protein
MTALERVQKGRCEALTGSRPAVPGASPGRARVEKDPAPLIPTPPVLDAGQHPLHGADFVACAVPGRIEAQAACAGLPQKLAEAPGCRRVRRLPEQTVLLTQTRLDPALVGATTCLALVLDPIVRSLGHVRDRLDLTADSAAPLLHLTDPGTTAAGLRTRALNGRDSHDPKIKRATGRLHHPPGARGLFEQTRPALAVLEASYSGRRHRLTAHTFS